MATTELEGILDEILKPLESGQLEVQRRIELSQRALALLPREQDPGLWAFLQRYLAQAYTQDPLDNRADNLERAIEHCEQALTVYTRKAFSKEWARTQHALATAYVNRIRGDQ